MSTVDVLNTVAATLAPLSYPVHLAEFLRTNAAGLLEIPDEPDQFIVHLITGEPEHEWGSTRFTTVTVQLDAFSTTQGTALAMLDAARPLLTAARFIPGRLRALDRDGAYTGAAQDYERGTA